jgi:hypothetical protein
MMPYTKLNQLNWEVPMDFGRQIDRNAPKPHLEDDGKYHGPMLVLSFLGVALIGVIFASGIYQVAVWLLGAFK